LFNTEAVKPTQLTQRNILEKSKFIWMDGALVDWDDAKIHVLTHTLHYGLGVFEGIRCYRTKKGDSAIFRLNEHMDRLFGSAKILGMDVPFTQEQLHEAVLTVVRENELEECYIRPIIFLGSNKMGLNPAGVDVRVSIAAWPWGAYLGDEGLDLGIRVRVSSFTRHHVNVTMTKAKACGYYINSILAKAEAIRDGYDEAILLEPSGLVSEGLGENIFLVKNGKINTPPLSCSNLAGITRDAVAQICKRSGYELTENAVTRDELYIADEIFLTGTAAEITPVREVDGRIIGAGKKGPVTDTIQKTYFEAAKGQIPEFDGWLTRI
jgi:branched-chain amino acid aminotransferase